MSLTIHKQLQALLDSAADKHIELSPGEYAGPITIRKSVVIDGKGATIWALNGPVVTVDGKVNVELRNLKIEVTGESDANNSHQDVAIDVKAGASLDLDDVDVRGDVFGVPSEVGHWRYPKTLFLGCIAPMQTSEYIIRMVTACPCRLISEISGVELIPSTLPVGPVEVKVRVDKLRRDTLLLGRILIRTAFSRRWFMINGEAAESSRNSGKNEIKWQPVDWDSFNQNGTPLLATSAPISLTTSTEVTTSKKTSELKAPEGDQSKNLPSAPKLISGNQLGIFAQTDSTPLNQPDANSQPPMPKGFPKFRIPGKKDSTPLHAEIVTETSTPLNQDKKTDTSEQANAVAPDDQTKVDGSSVGSSGAEKPIDISPPKRLKPASNMFRKDS